MYKRLDNLLRIEEFLGNDIENSELIRDKKLTEEEKHSLEGVQE
jgi:hypothetical protein